MNSAMLAARSPTGGLVAKALSSDHKPQRPDERARIGRTSAKILSERQLGIEGGDPDKWYVCRVQNGAIRYGVLFTRSIGDADAHAHAKGGLRSGASEFASVLDAVKAALSMEARSARDTTAQARYEDTFAALSPRDADGDGYSTCQGDCADNDATRSLADGLAAEFAAALGDLCAGVFSDIGAHSPREGVVAGAAEARRVGPRRGPGGRGRGTGLPRQHAQRALRQRQQVIEYDVRRQGQPVRPRHRHIRPLQRPQDFIEQREQLPRKDVHVGGAIRQTGFNRSAS